MQYFKAVLNIYIFFFEKGCSAQPSQTTWRRSAPASRHIGATPRLPPLQTWNCAWQIPEKPDPLVAPNCLEPRDPWLFQF